MLFNFLAPLGDDFGLFNLFRFLTFRTGGAVMTSMFVAFVIGPFLIRWLKSKQSNGQPIRADGPESHIVAKAGTPTMGGFLILISLGVATLLWADLTNGYVWAALLVTLGFGTVGFFDDYLKVTRDSHRGIPGGIKLVIEFVIAGIATVWIMSIMGEPLANGLAVPFFKDALINLGWLFVPFAALVMVGSSNAVNLTDGLDGLATMPVVIASATFLVLVYLSGNAVFSEYLGIPFVRGAGELAIFCACVIGACLAFLWFNAPPAAVFMGDTGSLALGGALGAIAVSIHHEIVLALVGGLFVLEAVSVIVQVFFFKRTGRRVFRMAPIHHHFEQLGWSESTIVIRFWIISLVLALAGLATLKLR